MATFIEYSEFSTNKKSFFSLPEKELTPIGYLTLSPEETLKQLLPNFYVSDYLDISIPSRSESDNFNFGLKISPIADGIGLIGTIEMLNKNDLFKSCKHKPFSEDKKSEIVSLMKKRMIPLDRSSEPWGNPKAKKYSFIFKLLGHQMSVEEIKKISTHKDYYNPIVLSDVFSNY